VLREPQAAVFVLLQPVMFVLMFRYVFGGAIEAPGLRYVDYLMPGIFVQTVAFGGITTAVGLATDLRTGHRRPAAQPADGAVGGAGRSHDRRHPAHRRRAARDGAGRPGRGLAARGQARSTCSSEQG
jgi:hypothetical protein